MQVDKKYEKLKNLPELPHLTLPVYEVVPAIGQRKALGILYFHAFTGCDVVSAFRGKGKKSAWLTWDVCDEVTETFVTLSQIPSEVCDEDLINLERFVTLLYDRTSSITHVDKARLELFARKQKPYDAIPPSRAALFEHAKRAAYQAGIIWAQATVKEPDIRDPVDWGWTREEDAWTIVWTTLPPRAACCMQLTKCNC